MKPVAKQITLWSLRTNASLGNHFRVEREVTEETAQGWLSVFREDEPEVLFVACEKNPKI